ncbi:MAG: TldD/PmbA family protein, partial [Clostridium sp.]|nr:TldD/PmbA family protein [Clostridium sp.]
MKLKESEYLNRVKPVLKKLLDKLQEEFKYASILATDCSGKGYTISKTDTSVSNNPFSERGCVVRVYNGKNYSEYAFNSIEEDNINEIIEEVKKCSTASAKHSDVTEYKLLDEEKIQCNKDYEVEKDPRELGDETIISKLTELKDYAFNSGKKEIIDFRTRYNYLNVRKMFLSSNKEIQQNFMWSEGYFICVAANESENKMLFKTFSGLKGAELLDEMTTKGCDEFIDKTISLLHSEKITPGEYDVICAPDITGLIAHEAFGHGVEMDMFVKDRAKSKDYIGKQVASPIVTMRDGSCAIDQCGSYLFDDEGVIGKDTTIIKDGILKSGINDELTALALNNEFTGNGRRESFDRKAYTRMTNTFIEKGNSKLDEMIASIDYGFLIDDSQSGMEDPKNWGIQCVASIGREIKNGKLTGKVFSPVIMTGYVPDLLKSISMIS